MLESLLIALQVFRRATLLKDTPTLMFPMKFAKFLRTPILKNICERLLLFFSSQNIIANSGGEFGLNETSAECKVSIFLNVTILFNQMQPYN